MEWWGRLGGIQPTEKSEAMPFTIAMLLLAVDEIDVALLIDNAKPNDHLSARCAGGVLRGQHRHRERSRFMIY